MSDANRQFYTDPDRIAEGLDFEGIPTQEVYDAYVTRCGENGYRPMNNTNFGKEVKRAFPPEHQRPDATVWHENLDVSRPYSSGKLPGCHPGD